MKKVEWNKTGVNHRKEWEKNGENYEVVADVEIHFKDGTEVYFKAKNVDCYNGRNEETKEMIYRPSIQGNSRGEEVEIFPTEAGKCELKVCTIQFSKTVIEADFTEMMKIVHAIEYVLEKDEKDFLIEPYEIPEED